MDETESGEIPLVLRPDVEVKEPLSLTFKQKVSQLQLLPNYRLYQEQVFGEHCIQRSPK